jgi:hypothetical protein
MNNNVIVNADTDSIMIARPDGSPWTKEQQQAFLDALNAEYPEKISFAHDGYYDVVGVFGSKNYALLLNKDFAKKKDLNPDGTVKLKTKGSALKDQKKEPAMREFVDKIIEALVYDKADAVQDIYHSYVKEALAPITDIRRWCQKKSLSAAIMECKGYTEQDILDKKVRRNETNIWDTVANEEGMQQGDKFYVYPVILETKVISGRMGKPNKNGISKPLKDQIEIKTGLKLDKYWKQDHDVNKLVSRCYDTLEIFELVLDMSQFLDYSKSTNAKFLEALK